MILQQDRLNCGTCDNDLQTCTIDEKSFPKGTIYLRSIRIPIENTPLKYHSFFCEKCESITKCLVIVNDAVVVN